LVSLKKVDNYKINKKEYVFKNKKFFLKYNPLSVIIGGGLYLYQNQISPVIQMGCLYEPSCSEFSKQAIANFGIFRGALMTIDRLTRCTRASSIDLHPLFLLNNGKYFDSAELYK
jgi:putative component of membrane protein insertase Oxa1/YidC/SpoIIIJ protein YidD